MPVADAFEGMCREDKGLIELPVAEGYGVVVGRLRPGRPVDIDELPRARSWPRSSRCSTSPTGRCSVNRTSTPVGANWKVTLDTYRENYHFDFLHRDTLASYAYGGVLTFDAFGPPPPQLLRHPLDRRAAGIDPRRSGEMSPPTSATSTRCSPTSA